VYVFMTLIFARLILKYCRLLQSVMRINNVI
jgi:hypothetical protein